MSSVLHLTSDPLSFGGQGWLFALNLWIMTAGTALMARLVKWQLCGWWKYRKIDSLRSPAAVYRGFGLLINIGITLRCGADAIKLWGWAPSDPQTTLWALHVKPFVDPFSIMFGMAGMALFALSLPGMMGQLRRRPLPIDFWPPAASLKKPVFIVICTALMSLAVFLVR